MMYKNRFRVVLIMSALVSWALIFSGGEAGSRVLAQTGESLQEQTLSGWLTLLYGDSPPGPNAFSVQKVYLVDAQGSFVTELRLDLNIAQALNGQYVEINGSKLPGMGEAAPFEVQAVRPLDGAAAAQSLQAVTGGQPWLIALCRFPDVASVPHPPAWYNTFFNGAYPSLDSYWQQVSYNSISLAGTTVVSQWYTLPYPRSYYIPNTSSPYRARLDRLARDCMTIIDRYVYFPQFAGVNLMFNALLDCCAWGGGFGIKLDGVEKIYRTTWIPPWGQVHDVMAHEMGHGFGFPHSGGPANPEFPTDEPAVYNSRWDVDSSAGGTCVVYDSNPATNYGCLSVGPNSYHVDLAGWIPANRRVFVLPGETKTVTLEQLRLPQTSNMLMVKVPIGGSNRRLYTIEARRQVGYDQNVPGNAVIIHQVDMDWPNHSRVVDAVDGNDDINDAGAMWLPGETYTDATNNIVIQVTGAAATGYTVQVTNGSTPQPYPNPPSDLEVLTQTATSVTIGWQDHAFNEDGFRIYTWQCDATGCDFRYYTSVPANQTTYSETFPGCGWGKFYMVSAYNGFSESEKIGWVYGTPRACSPTNSVPGRVLYTNPNVTLTWSAVTWAVQYQVQVSAGPTFAGTVAFEAWLPGGVLQTQTHVLLDGTYYWRVRAQTARGGWGAWSAPDTFVVERP